MLEVFLNSSDSQPEYSCRLYSYKKSILMSQKVSKASEYLRVHYMYSCIGAILKAPWVHANLQYKNDYHCLKF